MPIASHAPQWVSLNEIEATAARAARSAGYPWGLAEEAGKACRWLAMRGLPWLRPLCQGVLRQMHRLESFDSAARAGTVFAPTADDRMLGPVSVLVSLNDEVVPLPPAGAELSWRRLAAPVLLLPVLARLSNRHDRPILVRWPGIALECRSGEVFADAALRKGLEATEAEWVTIAREAPGPRLVLSSAATVRHQGAEVNTGHWRELLSIANPDYVPEAATTRLPGAGTGNQDES